MPAVQLRPTFLLETDLSAEEVMGCIQTSLQNCPEAYHGQFTDHHAMISIDESKRHFWSPWMHLEIRDDEQRLQVFGRFSPHPSIWTGFMFSYLSIAVLIFFALMFGVSQQLSGEMAWAYYFIPIGLIVAAVLWFASKAGQKLAHAEMDQMRSKIEECLSGSRSPWP